METGTFGEMNVWGAPSTKPQVVLLPRYTPLCAVQAAEKLKPHLLFLDLSMPRLHGLEALRQIRTASPNTRVLVLSMHNDEPYVIEALRAGAMAYILKGSESTEIARAVAEVVAGRRYLSAPLSERAIAIVPTG